MMFGVLVVLVVFFSSLMLQTHREYGHFKEREFDCARLTQARKEFEQKEAYLVCWKILIFLSVWRASGLVTRVRMRSCFVLMMSLDWVVCDSAVRLTKIYLMRG